MKSLLKLMIVLLISTVFLAACGDKETTTENKNNEKLTIYTTIYPLEDFTKKIGGEHVEVKSIFPPGVDAHSYEPTAKTMVDIAEADALIYTGVGVEGFMEAASDSLEKEDVKIIKASGSIEEHNHEETHEETESHEESHEETHEESASHEESHEETHEESELHEESHEETESHDSHDHGDQDPHIWLDPLKAINMADAIYHALVELRPTQEAEFKQNFDKLVRDLEVLDQEFQEVISSSVKKEILVSHAAYGYWESRYGIEQISITGLTPTNEPTQKDLQKVIETAKEHDIKYVIVEQNVSSKMSDTVKKELKAETLILRNLESITEQDANNDEDYFSLMRKNLETLKTALN